MAGFSFGATSHFLGGGDSYCQDDDVLQRSVDEDLEDLVQRNIRDVLQQVGVDDCEGLDSLAPRARQQNEHEQGTGRSAARTVDALRRSSDETATASPSYHDGIAATAAGALASQPARGPRQSSGVTLQSQQRSIANPSKTKRTSGEVGLDAMTSGAASRATGAAARNSTSSEVAPTGVGGALQGLAMNLDVPGQPEASLRLHKARIKALEEDLGRANKALLDREKQLTEALRELKELRTQAAGWARDKKALEGQLDRAKKQAAEAENLARTTETQIRELAKADSRAERERRASEAEVRARDVRLQRALEEVERYKQLLNDVRAQEREAKGSAQHDASRLLAENRRLERQRGELITAFKKQLKLIEVLKRQKVHLEAARALQFSEEEFLKTLEMGGT